MPAPSPASAAAVTPAFSSPPTAAAPAESSAQPAAASTPPPAPPPDSALAFTVHLEGSALWPFNSSLQAQLLNALHLALPSIPAANFTVSSAVQSQPSQGRRLLQAATAADASGQVRSAPGAQLRERTQRTGQPGAQCACVHTLREPC